MTADDPAPISERDQTDESLRVERQKADHALGEETTLIDETADAVISRARARADRLLAAARAKIDKQRRAAAPGAPLPAAALRERAIEDQILKAERDKADETLRDERAEHVALLSRERENTDEDLSAERARADDSVATRDEFMGIVSHDLQNMLTAVTGVAGLIAEAVPHENHAEQILKYAQRIQRSSARMSRLVGDLVDVASIDAGRLAVTREVGDPTPVVAEAVDTFQAQALASGVSVTAEYAPSLPPAPFDAARILQVLTNLLSNAIKFTHTGGQVVVRVNRVADDIQIAVSDTGIGIPADKLEAVFVRYHQVASNDRRGVGLGLYISKSIVLGHGGRIWAESEEGQGSTFRFTLPIAEPA
jgi:signal transduction histidine kinase